ncbi:hypothetical protein M2102_001373 [Fusobacterium sp. PH5-7]|uniref:hypothetical protein n=1 Tax=Fusobacterium sp. PH5-7 TaxID=2940528 RepID=UPI002473E3EE|nr:hypothetical protein [Fusobacterium sp. PH5-7]MDH6457744.1 hypothetical protein [Fusobacterium sp. PH5-7]
MKKIKLLSILGMIILLFAGCLSEADRAEKVLQKHLKERYGEEFVIYGMGKRAGNVRRWYEAAVVYPKSYIGTRKENDSYYWGKGFVELNNGMKGGDTYGKVLLNESASEFYGKKLKELFGENYLAVIDVKGPYSNRDFEKEMESRRISLEKELGGIPPEIAGGIYIFGRVENDEDREWYRKQIYEFIQFMKETGTFEYVALWVVVADERVLSDEFIVNNEDKEKLVEMYNKKDKEFRKQRAKIMKKYSKSYEETPIKNIKKRTEEILKSQLYDTNGNAIGFAKLTYYNELLVTPLYSKKHIKSRYLEDNYRLKDYNKIEDIEFTEEFY